MQHLYLGLAILLEVIATSALNASRGFTRPWPSVVVVLGYAGAFWFLAQALTRGLPMGIAYALWSGIGIVLIALVGWIGFGQRLDAAALAGIGLILAGVLVINLLSGTGH
ncbi:multidrug efflux SMR transporter [Roseomonas sp. KE0001]|uniref:DMT family transporter n=1 Tax=Roseomonas sp. KE0001 TaxID=2479201 RepID=UPI0018DF9E36|nr:SMR family transporter [Roseomonas sp. KE0001]MBI0433590.1 QacE family quaternary ammonium compound efflux SMR transporter [Roseomonas sp. KE0001]